MTVAAVVLAAGGGTRYASSGGQGPKPLAEVRGVASLERVLLAATAAQLDEVVVVDGAVDLRAHVGGATHLHNHRWAEGIATSLQVAIAHASGAGHEALVVGLADQPGVTSEAWRAVAAAPAEPPIAVATYDGRRANPVRLMASVWNLLPATGDEGARALMRERPDLVREVRCTGDPWDIDTVEDLERWS
jgi:molybdenum cofactor cytidylyltransferase